VFWGYVTYQATRSRRSTVLFWVVAIGLMLGLGVSRVALGVHYPQDVLGGWLIGLILLVAYTKAEPPVRAWLGRQGTLVQLGLALAVPLLLIFAHPAGWEGRYPAEDAITSMAAAAGLGVGVVMEQRWVRFRVEGAWWHRVLRYVVGLVIVLLFYLGPALLVPDHWSQPVESFVRFLRYGLLGWGMAFLSPWVFVRLRLAQKHGVLPGDDQQRM
jgi:membrane-associated phospholipid phosphatase